MAAKAVTSVYLTGAVVQVENTAAEVEALISSHGNTPNALVELTQEYEKEKQGVLKVRVGEIIGVGPLAKSEDLP